MNRHDELIEHLEDYLDSYDGATPLPADVRDAIRAQLPSIRQRPAWWPAQRFPEMNSSAKMAMAAVAVVAVALVGVYLFRPPNVGGPPLVEATASPSPTATPEPQPLLQGSRGPGTFTTEFRSEAPVTSPVVLTFELPAGWEGVRPWVVGSESAGTVVFVRPSGLYEDPCLSNSGTPEITIGTSAAELAAALEAHPAYDASTIGTFSIGGHDGLRMQVATPSDLDYATCEAGNFWLWDAPLYAGAPSQFDIWIFDLGDTTAVVLAEGTDLAQQQSQIEQMVQSITIQP